MTKAIPSGKDTQAVPPPPATDEGQPHKKQPRTTGLRVFDVFLYPFLTNFCVFAISVGATYLTSHGDTVGKPGSLSRKVGHFFQRRGDWMMKKFEGMGMNHGQADMAKMVFFSFADGTLVAPMVKLFEDRREKIARWIDTKLGTKPQDESVYAAEPKQGWLSVIGGRLAVVSIVVPTAVALDKTGLNDKLFSNPGLKAGEWVAKHPQLSRLFGKLHIPGLFKTGFFEAFYTSVCTAGLYFASRLFAGFGDKKNVSAPKAELAAPAPPQEAAAAAAAPEPALPGKPRAQEFSFAAKHALKPQNQPAIER